MRIAALLLVAGLLTAAAPAHGQRTLDERRAFPADGSIRIHNLAGSVRITGWDRDSIAVQGTVREGAEPFIVHVSGAGAKIGLWAGPGEAPASEIEVRVPRRSRVSVKTESAAITVRDVAGMVDVSSVTGRIEVRGTVGELIAESMAGTIDAEVDSRVLRARTAGGDIAVRGRVSDAQVLSVSGAVSVLNKQVVRGRFESVEGSVRFRGGLAPGSQVEIITHSGDVDVALPRNVSAQLTVSSFQGSVESLLQGKLLQGGGKGNRSQEVLLGTGGAELIVRTFKGAVRLGYL